MTFITYIILLCLVVYLSANAARIIDGFDKKTSISSSFIGGVVLATITSLPELITSVSVTVFDNRPIRIIGNVLSSNLFNTAVLALLLLLGIHAFEQSQISKEHNKINLAVLTCYLAIMLVVIFKVEYSIGTVSTVSLIIFIAFLIGMSIYTLKVEKQRVVITDEIKQLSPYSDTSMKELIVRYVITSLALILTAFYMIELSNMITSRLNLNYRLTGVILIGMTKSLPEVTATITLVRMRNYNLAIANLLGCNLFNMYIIFITDMLTDHVTILSSLETDLNYIIQFVILSTLGLMYAIYHKHKKSKSIHLYIGCLIASFSYLVFILVSL